MGAYGDLQTKLHVYGNILILKQFITHMLHECLQFNEDKNNENIGQLIIYNFRKNIREIYN